MDNIVIGSGVYVNGCVGSVEVETERHREKLLAAMQWPEGLQKEELDELKELVLEFEDVFALSDDELGCTEVVGTKWIPSADTHKVTSAVIFSSCPPCLPSFLALLMMVRALAQVFQASSDVGLFGEELPLIAMMLDCAPVSTMATTSPPSIVTSSSRVALTAGVVPSA